MSEKREIPGMWWLPTDPNDRWVGTLTLQPNQSPHLSVTAPVNFLDVKSKKARIIHGHNEGGIPITLLFSCPPRVSQSQAMGQMDLSAGYAVLGIHLDDAADFNVHTLMLKIQHLYEWSGISGFVKDTVRQPGEIHIRHCRPNDQSFVIDSDLSLELKAAWSSSDKGYKKSIEESVSLAFQSALGLNLVRSKELLTAVRHLLHFASMETVWPVKIVAHKTGYGKTYGEHFVLHDIELWSPNIGEYVKSPTWDQHWVFQLKDVQADFGGFFEKWLQFLKDYAEPMGCYFTTIYHKLPYEVEHLCLTQAFDAYHGIKFVSHQNRDFEEKIKELAETHKASLNGLVDDAADFATTVLHNRNYYTHHNPVWKERGRVLIGTDLFRLNEKLLLLFQMCVLSDMGIPRDRFVRLRRQVATEIVEFI
ncbi:MAG TPA: HEPN domain-containing protein [Opitutales bacterium]|nr:HEPN domain-containing protein [Opitutales bacterium]